MKIKYGVYKDSAKLLSRVNRWLSKKLSQITIKSKFEYDLKVWKDKKGFYIVVITYKDHK